ncbi:MAG: hypothetical protein ABSE64_02895 [Vulcanimicrobiaceae bacterium]
MELADDGRTVPSSGAVRASDFEQRFADLERILVESAKRADLLRSSVRDADKAARTGDLRALLKSAAAASAALQSLVPALDSVSKSLSHDFVTDMRTGAYAAEVAAEAAKENLRGVRAFQGSILSYPIALKTLPEKLAIQMRRKTSQNIRPSVVVQELTKLRDSQISRSSAQKLVDAIEHAFFIASSGQYHRGVPIRDIYKNLTPLPGQSAAYTELDFVADLYAIERLGISESSGHRKLSLPASTSTTGRSVIRVTTEEGEERLYSSVRFD